VGTALSGAIIATCVVVSILSRRNFKVMDRELDLDTQVWTQHLEGLR
jgi:hypothetical protein